MSKALGNNKALNMLLAILLSALFVCMAFFSYLGLMTMNIDNRPDNPNADLSDRIATFALPITLPDNQVMSGTVLIQAKNNIVQIIQPMNKWFFSLLFFSLLLYGCMVLWNCQRNRPLHIVMIKVPEIATRIGGHAPPRSF